MHRPDPTGSAMNFQQCGKQDLVPSSREPWSDQDLGWDPSLMQSLRRCLRGEEVSARQLDERLKGLERDYQNSVYSELIFFLSHLRFEPEEAKQHWSRILEHCEMMEERLRSVIDLRVGLISYFLHVNRMLESPKIIEMRVFEEARATAFQDELTGLRNYRFFVTYLSQEVRCSRQYNTPLSLVMIDVDYFKVYNDNNGHERGNEALMTIAGLLEKTLRGCDIAARYGGEEFVLLLPSTPKVGAQVVAERARRAIEEHVFPSGNSQPEGRLTASMGVATCPGDADKPEDLIRRADRAMYLAKADGRNQVRLYDGSHRSYRRVPAVLNGSFFRITGKPRPLTTVNISERGLSLLTDHEIAVGSLLEISLSLPDSHQQIVLNGKVVQGESTAKGQYRAGVHILEIGAQDRVRLVRYLREPGGWAAG